MYAIGYVLRHVRAHASPYVRMRVHVFISAFAHAHSCTRTPLSAHARQALGTNSSRGGGNLKYVYHTRESSQGQQALRTQREREKEITTSKSALKPWVPGETVGRERGEGRKGCRGPQCLILSRVCCMRVLLVLCGIGGCRFCGCGMLCGLLSKHDALLAWLPHV